MMDDPRRDLVPRAIDDDLDRLTRGAIPNGVVEQVPQDMCHEHLVGGVRGGVMRPEQSDAHAGMPCHGLLDGPFDEVPERDGLAHRMQPARF